MNITRRDFLKGLGAGVALLGVGATVPTQPLMEATKKSVPISPKVGSGVLIDTTRCVGCKSCQQACQVANGLPVDPRATVLSAKNLCVVDMKNISATPAKADIKPVKRQCMHCEEPACVSVCPVGALYKDEKGAVQYKAEVCMGCRYCMMACPFGVPKYDWDSPDPKINKCAQGCLSDGKRTVPACVQACPNQALYYGNREALLTIAKDRIAQNPNKYVNKVYGEKEVGGTSMLYLSATPFDQLGFRMDLPESPLPSYTWAAQEKIPFVLAGALTLLSGIAWWTHRKESKQLVPEAITVESE